MRGTNTSFVLQRYLPDTEEPQNVVDSVSVKILGHILEPVGQGANNLDFHHA